MPTNEELSATYESVMAGIDDPPERFISKRGFLAILEKIDMPSMRRAALIKACQECPDDKLLVIERDGTIRYVEWLL